MDWEKEKTKHELEEECIRSFDLIVILGSRVNELQEELRKIGKLVTEALTIRRDPSGNLTIREETVKGGQMNKFSRKTYPEKYIRLVPERLI